MIPDTAAVATICPKLTAGWNQRRCRRSSGTSGPSAAMAAMPSAALPSPTANTTPAVSATITVELITMRSLTSTARHSRATNTTVKTSQVRGSGNGKAGWVASAASTTTPRAPYRAASRAWVRVCLSTCPSFSKSGGGHRAGVVSRPLRWRRRRRSWPPGCPPLR